MKKPQATINFCCLVLALSASFSIYGQNCPLPQEYLPHSGKCSRIIELEYTFKKGKKIQTSRKEFVFNDKGQLDKVFRTLENGKMRNTQYLYTASGTASSWVNFSNEGVSTVSIESKPKKNIADFIHRNMDGSPIDVTTVKYDKSCQVIEEQRTINESLILGKKNEYNESKSISRMELLEPDELGRLKKSIMHFYVYLDNGLLWKHYYTSDKLVKHEYKYPSFDDKGNWTAREDYIANKQTRLGKKTKIINRTLTYE
jgi:hypothetical protein